MGGYWVQVGVFAWKVVTGDEEHLRPDAGLEGSERLHMLLAVLALWS